MFVSECLDINQNGHLTIGGVDTVKLAEKHQTPLFVYDENQIRKNCKSFKQALEKYYDGKGLAVYASKAFCCKEMCKVVTEEGLGLDIVSGGELFTALAAGADPKKMYFHGNNKTINELNEALEAGVGTIVVDNLSELEVLNSLAKANHKKVDIMFRIKPGIDAHTHDFIRTGQIDSKFGLALENGEALIAVEKALTYSNLHLKGLHCHIGSQIFDIDPFVLASEVMIKFIAQIKEKFGHEIEVLNLGGGFGISYIEGKENAPAPYENYIQKVSEEVKKRCEQYNIKRPFILIEPGRSIAGAAGITLYTVGAVKEIKDIRTYVSVDGGMCDNPRYALYKAEYTVLAANKADMPKENCVTVAGKCCESGDLIQENINIQDVECGDILAVLATGAYNYSMSSNYNRIPRPAVVFLKDGEDRVVIKRETYQDLIKNDL